MRKKLRERRFIEVCVRALLRNVAQVPEQTASVAKARTQGKHSQVIEARLGPTPIRHVTQCTWLNLLSKTVWFIEVLRGVLRELCEIFRPWGDPLAFIVFLAGIVQEAHRAKEGLSLCALAKSELRTQDRNVYV